MRFASIIIAGFYLPTTALAQDEPGQPSSGGLRARVVHEFDFDEAQFGNMEDIPMFWNPLEMADFPSFTKGEFDRSIGRTAPPSFYLSSAGRNVAFVYSGPDTRVRPGASYRVEGYIRSDRLEQGRACLAVHFVDRDGKALLDRTVRSNYVGGPTSNDEWTRVELSLPPAPHEAHAIGLTAWVLQERLWNGESGTRRPIDRVDVHAGAWFDDITVSRMPMIGLSSSSLGNVLPAGRTRELRILLNDPDVQELTGKLEVKDAAGVAVQHATVRQDASTGGGVHRVSVDALLPGLYHAELTVFAANGGSDRRRLTFALLAPRLQGEDLAPKSFGVVMSDAVLSDGQVESDLVSQQGVRSLKFPVWPPWGSNDSPTSAEGLELFLTELNRRGITPSAVLAGPPAGVVRAGRWLENPLLEVLGSSATEWTEELSRVAAPYAGSFRWWQLGADALPLPGRTTRMTSAATNLRAALGTFMTGPQISSVGVSLDDPTRDRLPVEHLTVALGRDVDTDWLGDWFRGYASAGYEQVSLFVPPLPEVGFDRLARLADWAQRVVSARHAGASIVYAPQPWTTRDQSGAAVTEPGETYLLLRTIADVLGEGRPGPRMFVGEGVRALTFESGSDAIMALWDPTAPPEGRVATVQLGKASRMIDAWGRVSRVERNADGMHLITLSPMPVFVDGVDRWIVDLGTSISLSPDRVTSGTEMVLHTLKIGGGGAASVSGQGTIQGPSTVEISPRDFVLRGSTEPTLAEFTARYSHTEPAGRKKFLVRLTVGADRRVLEVPVYVELGLDDVEVAGGSILEGDDLVLQHVVSNRSEKTLSFRGSAGVPGRERQYRPISNLAPGETQTVEYRFTAAADLIGRNVRLMLRELNDGPRTHTLELIVQ